MFSIPLILFVVTLLAAAGYGLWRYDRDNRQQREALERALQRASEQIRNPDLRPSLKEDLSKTPQAPVPPVKRNVLTGDSTRIAMQVAISFCLLAATLFVIFGFRVLAITHFAPAESCSIYLRSHLGTANRYQDDGV
jgi:hypothetical protein